MYGDSDKNDSVAGYNALTEAFLEVYASSLPQATMHLPQEVGAGWYTQVRLRDGMSLSLIDMTFAAPQSLSGISADDSRFSLFFCLGGGMQWRSVSRRSEYTIYKEECCFMDSSKSSGSSFFPEGGGIQAFGITLPEENLKRLLADGLGRKEADRTCRALQKDATLCQGGMRGTHKRIIHDITSCRLSGSVRHMYMEGKALELLAVYLDEFFFENTVITQLHAWDDHTLNRLKKARAILDADIANAPTLASLAHQVGLNEYKLKTGFKKLFGMPVHAYVIDKRLEEARYLLETKRLKVTDAALMVGYSEFGQFAGKFRRKFGITPSELLRSS